MIKIILLLVMSTLLFARGYHAPDNRSQAKNLVKMVYLDYKKTLLTGCDYIYDPTTCMDKTLVDTATCDVNEQNQSMVWIQVVPDTFYGRNMACMNENVCVSEFTGKAFKGARCCRLSSDVYKKMEAELFNLIPVVSAVAEKAKGKIFGEVKTPKETVGGVKFDENFVEPPDSVKGDIARVYLYMDSRYGLQLSSAQKELFLRWHRADAVDQRECSIAKVFTKVQGVPNPLVEEGCQKLQNINRP